MDNTENTKDTTQDNKATDKKVADKKEASKKEASKKETSKKEASKATDKKAAETKKSDKKKAETKKSDKKQTETSSKKDKCKSKHDKVVKSEKKKKKKCSLFKRLFKKKTKTKSEEEVEFSDDDKQESLKKLWDMLKKQAGSNNNYVALDTSKMPIEMSKELLSSLVYTLSLVENEDRIPIGEILLGDFYEVTKRGQDILSQKVDEVREEWDKLCSKAHEIEIENVFYTSTINNLETFFDVYDIKYSAHQVPCSIDYPLLAPVSAELRGISFIEEYVRRLEIESHILKGYKHDDIINLLKCVTQDYKKDFLNLCEPVLISTIGRHLLGYDLKSLSLSKDDVQKLYDLFDGKSRGYILTSISDTVDELCNRKNVGKNPSWYFTEEIKSMVARIYATENADELAKLFIPH